MRTSTIFSVALVAFSHVMAVSAAVNPSKVIARAPDATSDKTGVQSPSVFPIPNAPTSQGCFSADGNFTAVTEKLDLSSGSCYDACKAKKKNVMALHGGQCMCGSYYPPKKSLVSDKKCNYPCPFYPQEACGSLGDPGYYSVFNTGLEVSVENLPEPKEDDDDNNKSKSSSVPSSTSAESTAGATAPAATETQGDDEDQGDEKKSGPNTAGIAAGVVVGVAVIAGGIGGFFFWMRRRRNAEIEEDHRRNAAVNAFISGSKPPSSHGSISMTDSRLDPVLAHRRMSDGSIADNEDYSRRILRVTNA